MNNPENKLRSLGKQLVDSKNLLEHGQDIPVSECRKMVSELEELKTMSLTKQAKKEEHAMSYNVEELFLGFRSSADTSTELLQRMLSMVKDGKVPEEEAVEQLNLQMKDLRSQYSTIFEVVSAQLPEEDAPVYGSTVYDYENALANSKTIRYQKQLESAKKTLELFASVKSLIDSYASALAPFQKEALEFLNQLNTDAPESEEIEKNTAGPEAFLTVLSCENPDAEENMSLVDSVAEYYPTRVVVGVTTKKYYIEETSDSNTIEEKTEDQGDPAINKQDNESETSEEADADSSLQETKYADSEEDSENEPIDDKTESEFVKYLKANNAILEDRCFGILTKEVSPSEDKKISSSIFQNDMKKGGSLKAEKEIIEGLCKRNVLSAEQLTELKGMPEEVAENTLSYLFKKGYVRKYSITAGGSFYSASTKLMKAISFKESSKLIGVKQRPLEAWGEDIEDTAAGAATRLAFVKLYTDCSCILENHDVYKIAEQSTIGTEEFLLQVSDAEDPDINLLTIGAFFSSEDECDAFVKLTNTLIESLIDTPIVIIAGIDKETANTYANAIINYTDLNASEWSETNIFLYGLSENKYYQFETFKEVERDEIWPLDEEELYEEAEEGEADTEEGTETPESSDKKDRKTDFSEEKELENREEEESDDITVEDDGQDVEKTNLAVKVEDRDFKHDDITETTEKNDPIDQLYGLMDSGKFYAATAYAKAEEKNLPSGSRLYELLAYAVNDPMAHCTYSTENVFNMISQRSPVEDTLIIATALRTFFSNQVRYDYNIKPFYTGIKDYKLLNQSPSLSKVLYTLMEFKDNHKKGMDAYAGYRAKSQAELDKEIRGVQREANSFYENYVIGKKKENAKQRRFLETKKLMFSVNSDFGVYLKSIVDGEREIIPLIEDFLKEGFLKEDGEYTDESINIDKLWSYIVSFWEAAGDNVMYRKHADLMSRLRGNITSITTKAVQILIKWCALVEQASNHAEDAGTLEYRKIKKPLTDNIAEALKELRELKTIEENLGQRASMSVLINALDDLYCCIDGTYSETERKYFYIPFLLTEDVILDDTYLPDLEMHSSNVESLMPGTRILKHIKNLPESTGSIAYIERLHILLDEQGDDYGSAGLILDYLKETDNSADYSGLQATIDSGVSYAKETADIKKEDFTGELELAQSYGQIVNSTEDLKEKILQIVDEWYEWAVETSNYGFFRKVMEAYLFEIRESAKSRESDLQEQLQAFKETTIPNLTQEQKKKRIGKIQQMIDDQNYTVAEDLLARAQTSEDEQDDIVDEDFLKDFLDNYEDYYKPVATHKAKFATLVSSRTRNKEERGAKRLADNWLPGGGNLGRDRLAVLLNTLGFKTETIKPQAAVVRFENYIVTTAAAQGGRADIYTHPIAAFGSGASQDGFRVVCINGGYDADGLIDVMKQIGNAKHTLILLDHALSKSERRRLARKTKNALGDKFFGVIDRTVMMFLVRNYDETKINRMLISLIMPFGYYQPYVWESVNVMPPEIFMGRKLELERIKSPTGVNIVYGGRQLGKSALLKKAKDDVDWDENNDRAVYIDIKGLNYEEAARKIGHELFDQFVLTEDIDTKDWYELARAIRKRLQSTNKKIPYLLLLLDEADAFIESCGSINFKPLDALKEVQSVGTNRFKFVIAGLRNIVRFKREAALGNNSVLTHLQSMTVKPFNTSEARELMEIPLHYLGLRFPKEKESLVTLILASTNYFPGLIQLYCAKLLEAMRNKDYAGYDEVDTPIYEVSEDHIKRVLADPDFMQQIREKYIITLKLDEDNYYYLIALIMAYLYHNNGYNEGYSAEDIHAAGSELEISRIADLDTTRLNAFMEELEELNVLRRTDDTHYLFTRFTFFQMMGTSSEVEDKLVEYMGA